MCTCMSMFTCGYLGMQMSAEWSSAASWAPIALLLDRLVTEGIDMEEIDAARQVRALSPTR